MNSIRSSNGSHKNHNYRSVMQSGKTETTFFHLASGETIEAPMTRFKLFDNSCEASSSFVEIQFYLPKPASAKLVLMDSRKNDILYLINKELNAGNHVYKSQISNEELRVYKYYYKLDAYGYNEIKEMKSKVRC